MPQPQPRRQQPTQHRRNNDLNRKTPTPRIDIPPPNQQTKGQHCTNQASDNDHLSVNRITRLGDLLRPSVGVVSQKIPP